MNSGLRSRDLTGVGWGGVINGMERFEMLMEVNFRQNDSEVSDLNKLFQVIISLTFHFLVKTF